MEKEPGNSQISDYLNGILNKSIANAGTSNTARLAEEALQQGISFHQLGLLDEAIHCYRKTLQLNSNNADALSNMGGALQYTGKLDEAVISLTKAISIKPDFAEAFSNLGNALKEQGKLDEAVASYQKAISIKPDYTEAFHNLGNVLTDQGKLDEAVASYRKALSFKQDYAEVYSNLGAALQEQGKLDKAVDNYQKAISFKPGYAKAYNNLGVALKNQGKLNESVASYQKAISIKPDYAEAYSNLGFTLIESGKLEEAVASCQKAISIKPDCAEAYSNLGAALKEQGKPDEAVASYQKKLFLRLNHDATEAIPADFPGIASILIELTNRCNFHCSFCPSDDQTRNIGEMSIALVQKIFDEISSKKLADTVNLHHMGEPTLFRHLREVLHLASKYGLKVELVTNGSTLKKSNIELLLNELSGKLILSLQTPTRDSFKLRGTKMQWDEYIASIKDLITAYVSRFLKGSSLQFTVEIRLMKTDSNRANVEVLSDKESVVSQINYWSDFIGSLERQEGVTPYQRKQPNLLLHEWFAKENSIYVLRPGIKLNFWSNFTFANTIVDEYTQLTYLDNTKFCHHPFSEISILWDGRCVPCCLDYDGQLNIGDANVDSLESILMSAKASQLRNAFLGDGSIPEYCKKCQAEIV